MAEWVEFGKDGLRVKGEKIIPMCAAFHYWRVEPRWWDDILGRLIKGAEMTMVASYIPWSFHEKVRGDFDFTGRRDPKANLKDFLDLVHKHGLYFVARTGSGERGFVRSRRTARCGTSGLRIGRCFVF